MAPTEGKRTVYSLNVLKSRMIRLALLVALVSGCSHMPRPSVQAASEVPPETAAIEFQDFNLDENSLEDLLTAEIALQRDNALIAIVNYLNQSRITRDIEVVKRAIQVAQYAKDTESLIELGHLWLDIEPNSVTAHQMLSFQYTYVRDYESAFKHIDALLALGEDPQASGIALHSQKLSRVEREDLLVLFEQTLEKHPEESDLSYAIAFLNRAMGNFEGALATIDALHENDPDHVQSKVLKADILRAQRTLEEALAFAKEAYNDHPQDHNLGRIYASLLIDAEDFEEAEVVFEDLIEQYPQIPTLKLSLALVKLENEDLEGAKATFQELHNAGLHRNEANYYLGRLADQADDPSLAIRYYQQVQGGLHFVTALERSSYLLVQQERTDEAIERLEALRVSRPDAAQQLWRVQTRLVASLQDDQLLFDTLNQALADFPNDDQILYSRAMLHEKQDDLASMEADLRMLIEQDPNNAVALNALGYTLADRTDRIEEAFQLIQAALKLNPDNPAILDSMGWVLYRSGKLKEALPFIVKAYEAYKDPEVAAHLGEILWQLDQKDQALAIWRDAYNMDPDHRALKRALDQFDVIELVKSDPALADEDAEGDSESDSPTAANDAQ